MKTGFIFIMTIIFVSCSSVSRVGVRAMGGILDKAGKDFTRESDLEFFRKIRTR